MTNKWTNAELIHTLSQELEEAHRFNGEIIAPTMKIIEYEHPLIGKPCRYCGEVDHVNHDLCPVNLLEIAVAKFKWWSPNRMTRLKR